MILTAQLLENSQCDRDLLLNGVQVTSSSRFASNGDGRFCTWMGCFDQAGDYLAIVQYRSSGGPLRVILGDASHVDMPETEGGSCSMLFTIGNAGSALIFDDRGDAETELTHVDLFRVLAS